MNPLIRYLMLFTGLYLSALIPLCTRYFNNYVINCVSSVLRSSIEIGKLTGSIIIRLKVLKKRGERGSEK